MLGGTSLRRHLRHQPWRCAGSTGLDLDRHQRMSASSTCCPSSSSPTTSPPVPATASIHLRLRRASRLHPCPPAHGTLRVRAVKFFRAATPAPLRPSPTRPASRSSPSPERLRPRLPSPRVSPPRARSSFTVPPASVARTHTSHPIPRPRVCDRPPEPSASGLSLASGRIRSSTSTSTSRLRPRELLRIRPIPAPSPPPARAPVDPRPPP